MWESSASGQKNKHCMSKVHQRKGQTPSTISESVSMISIKTVECINRQEQTLFGISESLNPISIRKMECITGTKQAL